MLVRPSNDNTVSTTSVVGTVNPTITYVASTNTLTITVGNNTVISAILLRPINAWNPIS